MKNYVETHKEINKDLYLRTPVFPFPDNTYTTKKEFQTEENFKWWQNFGHWEYRGIQSIFVVEVTVNKGVPGIFVWIFI